MKVNRKWKSFNMFQTVDWNFSVVIVLKTNEWNNLPCYWWKVKLILREFMYGCVYGMKRSASLSPSLPPSLSG